MGWVATQARQQTDLDEESPAEAGQDRTPW
jgi:hypothetical protein